MSAMKVLCAYCRNNIYLIVGICLGLSMSLLLSPIEIDDCDDLSDPLLYSSNHKEFVDDYEPIINTKEKPQQAKKIPKLFVRPRYYSTELGIRDKLFVGILSSSEHLHSRAIALNKTIAHLVDKLRFFILIPEGVNPNVSLSGIVGFTDMRIVLKPFHVLKYITDYYMEDYDYYFLIKDSAFINARKLRNLVEKLSVSDNVHLGMNSEMDNYCSLDAGVLLSNSVIREVKSSLDSCVKSIFSNSDDINFGRCILRAIPVPCKNFTQGEIYTSNVIPNNFSFHTDFRQLTQKKNFLDSVSVFPILDHRNIYKINAYFSMMQLLLVQEEITNLRNEIKKMANFGPEDQRNVSWPVGNNPKNKAQGRFDILRWIYFNETHLFLSSDFENIREIKASIKQEIDEVLKAAIEKVINQSEGKLIYKNLVNGYRKFDASRGIDFIVDLNFTFNSNQEIIKRMEICKPLGKVEILPVPYVTENSRLNMILIVNADKQQEAIEFLVNFEEICLKAKNKVVLMMVLLYNPDSLTKGLHEPYFEIKGKLLSLSDKYKKDPVKLIWLSIRLPFAFNLIETEPLLQISIADLAVRKFSPDSLVLFLEMGMEIRIDYLNRVKMNTISQWQIFSPIPFVEFHPDIAYAHGKKVEFDLVRTFGRYDEFNFNSVAFYAKDYIKTRKGIESKIPIARTDADISKIIKLETKIGSIFEMFVLFSDLYKFRAVEPNLKIRYKEMNCNATNKTSVIENCRKQKNLRLSHRADLAKLIIEYQSQNES